MQTQDTYLLKKIGLFVQAIPSMATAKDYMQYLSTAYKFAQPQPKNCERPSQSQGFVQFQLL